MVLGNLDNRRVHFFAEAAARAGWPRIIQVSWESFLRGEEALENALRGDVVLRIESPGENFEVERQLLQLGYEDILSEPGFATISPEKICVMSPDNGQILPSRQWFHGWSQALRKLEKIIRQGTCVPMTSPDEIAIMFDKAACHYLFQTRGVRTPRLIGEPEGFDSLMESMRKCGVRRVFLKPCHASSASGVMALEIRQAGMQAFTTIEREGDRLYNSLRVHRHEKIEEIRPIVDAICRHRCIAESWLPKAGFQKRRIDLRMLVVAGETGQAVLRQSNGPMTNLHLGNRRGDLAAFRDRLGESQWQAACEICLSAAAAFPGALHAGIDLLVSPSLRSFAVAEINAFGDLLPKIAHNDMSTYELELHRLDNWLAAKSDPLFPHVSTNGR